MLVLKPVNCDEVKGEKMEQILRGDYVDISLAKNLLEKNGIACLMKSEHGAGFVIQTGGAFEQYDLFVSSEDRERALALCAYLTEPT